MSTIKLENIQTRTGSGTITIGASGETVEVASGVTTNLKNGATLSDNILFDTASKGIYLGVTSATASNLLNDYEEGTWTPTVASGFASFSVATSTYVKTGKTVLVQFTATGMTSKDANQVIITGLPFSAPSDVYGAGILDTGTGAVGYGLTIGSGLYFFTGTTRSSLVGNDLGGQMLFTIVYKTT